MTCFCIWSLCIHIYIYIYNPFVSKRKYGNNQHTLRILLRALYYNREITWEWLFEGSLCFVALYSVYGSFSLFGVFKRVPCTYFGRNNRARVMLLVRINTFHSRHASNSGFHYPHEKVGIRECTGVDANYVFCTYLHFNIYTLLCPFSRVQWSRPVHLMIPRNRQHFPYRISPD